MSYLVLKYVHILSATLLFGTGIGTAFHGLLAYRTADPRVVAAAGRSVVLADWLFTAPAVVVQPVTGVLLAHGAGYPPTTPWLVLAVLLYAGVGACWLPVVWLQIRLRRLAQGVLDHGGILPPLYRRYTRLWFALGWPAFGGVLAIYYLMIFKPEL